MLLRNILVITLMFLELFQNPVIHRITKEDFLEIKESFLFKLMEVRVTFMFIQTVLQNNQKDIVMSLEKF